MRDIIFRGRRVDNGDWVEGFYWTNGLDDYFIRTSQINSAFAILDFEVEEHTVGQYTGLTDKNGKRIFEGDIVKTNFFGKDDGKGHNFADYDIFSVKWNDCGFAITNQIREFGLYKSDASIEVIGNIHENPELLA